MNVKSLVLSIDETLYDRIKQLAEERAAVCPTHRDVRRLEAGYRSVRGLDPEEQRFARRILENSHTPPVAPLYWAPADAVRYQDKRLRARLQAIEAARAALPNNVAARKPSVLSVIRELIEIGLNHLDEVPPPPELPAQCKVALPPANMDPDTGKEFQSIALVQCSNTGHYQKRTRA